MIATGTNRSSFLIRIIIMPAQQLDSTRVRHLEASGGGAVREQAVWVCTIVSGMGAILVGLCPIAVAVRAISIGLRAIMIPPLPIEMRQAPTTIGQSQIHKCRRV